MYEANHSLTVELNQDTLEALAEFEAAENRLQKLVLAPHVTSQDIAQARKDLAKWAMIVTLRTKACATLAGRPWGN